MPWDTYLSQTMFMVFSSGAHTRVPYVGIGTGETITFAADTDKKKGGYPIIPVLSLDHLDNLLPELVELELIQLLREHQAR